MLMRKNYLNRKLITHNSGRLQVGSVDGEFLTKTDNTFRTSERNYNSDGDNLFSVGKYEVNIIDTPGHMDFLASISFIISFRWGNSTDFCKDGVQAQTRILFHTEMGF